MTPADRRITELIDKWLASIDLHLKYVELSDAAYARVQAWPKHDRPTRWVLEVARQKILELKAQCETRHAMGDGRFSESLELMAFLANLVGIQLYFAAPDRDVAGCRHQVAAAVIADRVGVERDLLAPEIGGFRGLGRGAPGSALRAVDRQAAARGSERTVLC